MQRHSQVKSHAPDIPQFIRGVGRGYSLQLGYNKLVGNVQEVIKWVSTLNMVVL